MYRGYGRPSSPARVSLKNSIRDWQGADFFSDGGGKVAAARRPLFGQDHVVRFLQGIFRLRPNNMKVEIVEINAAQSLLIWVEEQLIGVMNFLIFDDQIQEIRTVLNSEKLTHVPFFNRPRRA